MKREITTIKLSKSTVGILNKSKIHPRQPYEEVILRLIPKKQMSGNGFNLPLTKKDITTIKISKNTVQLLNNLKIHPRQSYEEVVLRLLLKNEKTGKRARFGINIENEFKFKYR
ncbi:hypothetical protein CMO83_03980 [Candidatus Woesearchaeota archaeon]|jgi:predicted CopG family antitoxin|nr:hypothetical protein [Candidatus Woesearchaeota archaeon]MAG91809.1 hypothetical protein [Candidatus Woesearchaeota archaeon]|tara:strand:- start:2673 stop:3014 length:342 start_codon:yes stop_codon:yes gene_type:complete